MENGIRPLAFSVLFKYMPNSRRCSTNMLYTCQKVVRRDHEKNWSRSFCALKSINQKHVLKKKPRFQHKRPLIHGESHCEDEANMIHALQLTSAKVSLHEENHCEDETNMLSSLFTPCWSPRMIKLANNGMNAAVTVNAFAKHKLLLRVVPSTSLPAVMSEVSQRKFLIRTIYGRPHSARTNH